MTPEEFASLFHVKQSMLDDLGQYAELLATWSGRINLVSSASMAEIWKRHFADSAQLLNLLPSDTGRWLDFGAGAGFPGMVLALLAPDRMQLTEFVLIESDLRKCAFLTELARVLSLDVTIHAGRLEDQEKLSPNVISARAVAPLGKLLALSARQATDSTRLIFPKGGNLDHELTQALADWHIEYTRIPSRSDPAGEVLLISEFYRK